MLAGGTAAADATSFSMRAAVGDPQYPIGEGRYLTANASSVTFETTITVNGDGTWTYEETTMLRMKEFPELLAHTDHNTLHKVDQPGSPAPPAPPATPALVPPGG